MKLVADIFLLYTVNIHQCNLFTMCRFFNSLFTATGNNKTNFHYKLPIIVFQINSISLIN